MEFLTTYSPFYKVAGEYLASEDHLESQTVIRKRRLLDSTVFPIIGNKAVSEICDQDIHNLLKSISYTEKKYAVFHLVKNVFYYAQSKKLIVHNPCAGIKVVYRHRKPSTELTDDQLASLAKVILQIPFPEIYSFALLSGLPFNECAALRRSDIELSAGKCSISYQWRKQNGSKFKSEMVPAKRKRVIDLPAPCLEYLRTVCFKTNSELLFPSKTGSLLVNNDIQNCLMIIHNKSELKDFKNDRMRENYIIRCLQMGVDLACLEQYYGYRKGHFITSEKMYNWVDVGLAGRYDYQRSW